MTNPLRIGIAGLGTVGAGGRGIARQHANRRGGGRAVAGGKRSRCSLTAEIGEVPIDGIKNLSANSCESLGGAHQRALGDHLTLAEPAQFGEGAHHGLLQQQEARAGEVTIVGRMLEVVVDGHGVSGV